MSVQSSSSGTSNPQSSSATNLSAQESYLRQYVPKPQTPAQIRASGEVSTRIGILWLIGVISVLLISIGGYSLIADPKNAKDVWVIIGPIITSAVTGTVAFFTGEKQGERR